MEDFSKKNPETQKSTSGFIIEDRLNQLAMQTNAETLFVFKLAETTARDHHDMELFLKLRKNYARKRIEKGS
jgi:hypothetical protein